MTPPLQEFVDLLDEMEDSMTLTEFELELGLYSETKNDSRSGVLSEARHSSCSAQDKPQAT